jgi:glycosyltransferase involved in cell wall biosynthesis
MTHKEKSSLSVIVPLYNEQEVLPEFHRRLMAVFDQLNETCEVVYINDGSRDESLNMVKALFNADDRVSLVDLSRNFGKEVAMSAGLQYAKGEAVVVIDADLQDPPELIPELVRYWKEGYDIAYAQRTAREGEGWFKKLTAYAFYRLIDWVTHVEIPSDTGDFRLLSRRAVDALLQLPERHRFMKGLFAWIGFRQVAVPYRRDPRFAGETKWNYWKLWNFAIEGITSFSIAPLKIATYFGFTVAVFASIFAGWIIFKTLVFGETSQGYPTIMVTILFLGGAQLVAIGILGEYLGRMFNETKQRPLFFTNQYLPARRWENTPSSDNEI